jgi:non-ribosomal peptide synthetase component F
MRTMRTMTTLVDLLAPAGTDHAAVLEHGETIDYVALCNAADAIAAALVVRGVRPGDRVAAALPDGAAALAAFGGTVLARAAFAPLVAGERQPERLAALQPRLILVPVSPPQQLRVAAAARGIPIVSVAIERGTTLVDGEPVYEAHGSVPGPEDVVFIEPHGTPVTQAAIVAAAAAIEKPRGVWARQAAPLSELRGLADALATLAAGGRLSFEGATAAV